MLKTLSLSKNSDFIYEALSIVNCLIIDLREAGNFVRQQSAFPDDLSRILLEYPKDHKIKSIGLRILRSAVVRDIIKFDFILSQPNLVKSLDDSMESMANLMLLAEMVEVAASSASTRKAILDQQAFVLRLTSMFGRECSSDCRNAILRALAKLTIDHTYLHKEIWNIPGIVEIFRHYTNHPEMGERLCVAQLYACVYLIEWLTLTVRILSPLNTKACSNGFSPPLSTY